MNTKTFAQESRKILLKGVANKLRYWGFDAKGQTTEQPVAVGGGVIFRGQPIDDRTLVTRWNALREAVQKKGMEVVMEEAAYTWFNRMMAMRILSKNGYDLPQLEYVHQDQRLPVIVQQGRRGHYPFLQEAEQQRLQQVVADFSKEQETFTILLVGYCQSHPLLKRVFGKIDDYTEMLLPDDILAEDGFVHLLNTTDAISDAEYQEVELIGWLYQFYISQRKDEVFASFKKKKKAEAKDIPAATQIFTPNWIVKYMVQNTIGKIWLDKNPDSALRDQMKYLVENEGATAPEKPLIEEVAHLKLLDPAAGSGHILVEGFDWLYQMYMEEYYEPEEAVESILKNNLFGLDIDKRAQQLACFAVLMKAAKVYPKVLETDWMPNIYAMPETHVFNRQEVLDFLGTEGAVLEQPLTAALRLMEDAQNLGSIMQFDLGKWDLKNERVLTFLVENEHVKADFYDDTAVLIADLAGFVNKLIETFKDWSFTKAGLLRKQKADADTLEQLLDTAQHLQDAGDNLGFLSKPFRQEWLTQDLLDLDNQAKEKQKLLLKAVKKLMSDLCYLHEQQTTLLEKLNLTPQTLDDQLLSNNKTSNDTRKELLRATAYFPRRYLTLDLEIYTLDFLKARFLFLKNKASRSMSEDWALRAIAPYLKVLLVLTQRYEAVVANPPYMGSGNMNGVLKNYVNDKYPVSKADFMTVFMEVIPYLTRDKARFALINLPSWLFLSSFEELRRKYVNDYFFESLLHMGRGIFGIDFGSTAFVIKKENATGKGGNYFRLHERNFQHIYYKDIEKLFLYSKKDIDYKYNFKLYRGEEGVTEIPIQGSKNGLKISYRNISQIGFPKIPGCPIAFWVNNKTWDLFNEDNISKYGISDGQNITGDNEKYLRKIWEINNNNIGRGCKWVSIAKGGSFRKWYGNIQEVINWSKDAREFYKSNKIARIQDKSLWFRLGITWNLVSSTGTGFRILNENGLFNKAAPTILFDKDHIEKLNYVLGLLNTKLVKNLLKVLNPTFNTNIAEILNVPVIIKNENFVKSIVKESIQISKTDWDSTETSWDFQQSPLINATPILSQSYQKYGAAATASFFQLHENEEALNRIFIDLYGLQDELTPEVSLKDITILQEELDSKALEALEADFRAGGAAAIELPIRQEVVMQQLISYVLGLMMGRYRLDKPGLHITHPQATAAELAAYTHQGVEVEIDDDAIVPVMGQAGIFSDDAVHRFGTLLDAIWGADSRIDNMNFLQSALDKDLDKYLVSNFWSDHCKRYKKKPIYWLFSSPKGAFQVLVYLHRMNEFTVTKIRDKYMLPHLRHLRTQIGQLENQSATLSSQESRGLDALRK
ncbi:MAG: hypothetical protein ACI85O_000444, partial [Saprospiraceae bacterium]